MLKRKLKETPEFGNKFWHVAEKIQLRNKHVREVVWICESPLLNTSAATDVLLEILPMHDDRATEDADAWHDPLVLEVVYTPLIPDALPFVGSGSDILLVATGHPYIPIYQQALSHFIALP